MTDLGLQPDAGAASRTDLRTFFPDLRLSEYFRQLLWWLSLIFFIQGRTSKDHSFSEKAAILKDFFIRVKMQSVFLCLNVNI